MPPPFYPLVQIRGSVLANHAGEKKVLILKQQLCLKSLRQYTDQQQLHFTFHQQYGHVCDSQCGRGHTQSPLQEKALPKQTLQKTKLAQTNGHYKEVFCVTF